MAHIAESYFKTDGNIGSRMTSYTVGWQPMRITFAIHTLGCKVNQCDSERLASELCKLGFERRQFGEPADVCIINTCAVTHVAEQKSRKAVSRARRMYEGSLVVAIGCGVELDRLRGNCSYGICDASFGVREPGEIAREILLRARSRMRESECSRVGEADASQGEQVVTKCGELGSARKRVRSNLKVQDGCDRMCAYCIVPFLRGKPRSRPIEEVVAEAKALISCGCREVVLTGVCLGSYGSDLSDGVDIVKLVERLCKLDGLVRLRLSSLDPRDVSEDLILLASSCEKVCPHFHISLQSGDDEVLRAMNRGYTTAQYERIVNSIRDDIPDVAITTDVLVGFPVETEKHFERTLQFVERMGFARVHVFKFSPRPFTKAASMQPLIPSDELNRRMEVMLSLARELSFRFKSRFIGRQLDILVEEAAQEGDMVYSQGLSGNYIRVRVYGAIEPGNVVRANLETIGDGDFVWASCSKVQ